MVRLSALVPADRAGWILTGTTFVGAVGFGAFAVSSVIFFTRSIGLSVGQVGVGVASAGVVGLLGPVLVGRVADRFGAREVFVLVSVLQAALFVAYAVVHSFPMFLAVVCALGFAERSASALRNAVIAGMTAGGDRVRLKAYLRAVFNVGVSLGAVGAAVPLHLDTRSAYLTLVFFNAGAAALTAMLAMALPRVAPPSRTPGGGRWLALRDTPYVAVALVCGLLATHHSLLVIALPIWVATRTDAPGPVISALFVLNTAMVIALQVWASKHAGTVRGAIGAARRGAWVIVPGCALIGISALVPAAVAIAALIVGVALLTLGELWTSVAAWSFSFEFASPQAPAQYQGAFSLGMSVESIAGPLLATSVVLGLGVPGWLVAAAVFLLLGYATHGVASWASFSGPRLRSLDKPLATLA